MASGGERDSRSGPESLAAAPTVAPVLTSALSTAGKQKALDY
jgi:hypothetical protein